MSDPLRNFWIKPSQIFKKMVHGQNIFLYLMSLKISLFVFKKPLELLVRDGSDIQRVMAIVWMATFPTMFLECIT